MKKVILIIGLLLTSLYAENGYDNLKLQAFKEFNFKDSKSTISEKLSKNYNMNIEIVECNEYGFDTNAATSCYIGTDYFSFAGNNLVIGFGLYNDIGLSIVRLISEPMNVRETLDSTSINKAFWDNGFSPVKMFTDFEGNDNGTDWINRIGDKAFKAMLTGKDTASYITMSGVETHKKPVDFKGKAFKEVLYDKSIQRIVDFQYFRNVELGSERPFGLVVNIINQKVFMMMVVENLTKNDKSKYKEAGF